jgi:hypothetical protein
VKNQKNPDNQVEIKKIAGWAGEKYENIIAELNALVGGANMER